MLRPLLTLVFFLNAPALLTAQERFEAVHGLPGDRYSDWVRGLDKKGLRAVFVSAGDQEGSPIFAGIAEENTNKFAWDARHGLTADQFQDVFLQLVKKDFRLTCVWGYLDRGTPRFAAIWTKDGDRTEWQARSGLTSAGYQKVFDELVRKGFRPVQTVGYPGEKEAHFAAIFIKDRMDGWVARHDLTERQFQETFDSWAPKGYRPISLSSYPTGAGTRFSITLTQDKGGPSWKARHGLTSEQYQAYFDEMNRKGLRPTQVVAYPWDGGVRYAAVFGGNKPAPPPEPLPMAGQRVPELDALDEAMQKFLAERRYGAATLAVSKGGKLVLERAYGWSDREQKVLLGPTAKFRLASVSKPITLAAILKLIAEGKLRPDDSIVVVLGLRPLPGQTLDPRWKDITIEHLMKHRGGWDRGAAFDPMFRPLEIAHSLKRPAPASADDVIQYMLGQPLQFDPGSKSAYSNFGYCLLGRVIEKVSGKSYIDHIRAELLAPIGIKGIDLGRSLPKDRDPAEPVYLDPATGVNLFDIKGKRVPAPDGTFHLEAMDAHGGLIAPAAEVVRFLDHYWINGQPRKAGESQRWAFFGSLPGTWTVAIQRPDGVNIVALFNNRAAPAGMRNEAILEMLNQAADGIKVWP